MALSQELKQYVEGISQDTVKYIDVIFFDTIFYTQIIPLAALGKLELRVGARHDLLSYFACKHDTAWSFSPQ